MTEEEEKRLTKLIQERRILFHKEQVVFDALQVTFNCLEPPEVLRPIGKSQLKQLKGIHRRITKINQEVRVLSGIRDSGFESSGEVRIRPIDP